DGEVGIREDRGDAEDDKGGGVVPEADTEPGDEDADERDARERAADRGRAEGEEQPPVPVAEPEADRHGDEDGNSERGEGELRRLGRLLQQQRPMVGNELQRVDEERGEHYRCLLHGVRARCSSASSASAVRAKRIARPPATTSSVRKMSGWLIASKIGPPRP